MKIVDSFWIDTKSAVCTVDVTDDFFSADDLFVDVKIVFEGNGTLVYVMDNHDGTQLYDKKDNTYNMSKANQDLVCRFVEERMLREQNEA